MTTTLLDASLAGLAAAILIVLLIIVTFIEAMAMLLMKFNRLGKCFFDSFLVNLASLAAGYLISAFTYNIVYGGDNYEGLLASFIVTVLVEGLVLRLLNRKSPSGKVWKVNLVMNVSSYTGILIIFIIQG